MTSPAAEMAEVKIQILQQIFSALTLLNCDTFTILESMLIMSDLKIQTSQASAPAPLNQ